jgi:hypothetical protein
MKKGGDYRFFSRRRNRGWRKRRQRRQRKWKKDKEKDRWAKKIGSGKEAQRERNGEDTKGRAEAKKITETAKVRVLY